MRTWQKVTLAALLGFGITTVGMKLLGSRHTGANSWTGVVYAGEDHSNPKAPVAPKDLSFKTNEEAADWLRKVLEEGVIPAELRIKERAKLTFIRDQNGKLLYLKFFLSEPSVEHYKIMQEIEKMEKDVIVVPSEEKTEESDDESEKD